MGILFLFMLCIVFKNGNKIKILLGVFVYEKLVSFNTFSGITLFKITYVWFCECDFF